jgi:hypothetical protein
MVSVPAYVRNGRLDVLAANRLSAALFAPMLDSSPQPAQPGDPRPPLLHGVVSVPAL